MEHSRVSARWRRGVGLAMTAGLLIALAAGFGTNQSVSAAGGRTYTSNADFDEGTLVGLNHTAGSDQLQINETSTTFPFIWVANSGEGTVSKLDTRTGVELGRFRSAPDSLGKDPSRTTVDRDGNVWVGNRGGNTVTKIGLLEADNCIDRNGNGVIETSTGKTDVKPWPGTTVATAVDECILLNVTLPAGSIVRMVAVDANNDIYAGLYSGGMIYHIDSETGTILGSWHNPIGVNYGGVVDPEGKLWIATWGYSWLVKFDPDTKTFQTIQLPHGSYGLGIDKFGNIWNSGFSSGKISKIRRSDGTVLGTYGVPGGCDSRGVAVEDNGDVWVANTCSNTLGRLAQDGSGKGTVSVGNGPTGVAIDADGKIWTTNLWSDNATRIDPVTLTRSFFGVGDYPYNYSDMTGHIIRNITTIGGTWTTTYDSGSAGTEWDKLSWHGNTPAGTEITGRVRAADAVSGLGGHTYQDAGNGVALTGVTGRYIQIQMGLESDTVGVTPVLHDVTIDPVLPCDPTPALDWIAPPDAGTPYDLPAGDTLPIRFHWGTCGSFIHDESVIISIQDAANPDYPLTTWVYGWDITIDDDAQEYQVNFSPSQYGVGPGSELQVQVFIGDAFVGEAQVHIIP